MNPLLVLAASVTLTWDPVVPVDLYTLYVGILPITVGNLPLIGYPTLEERFTVDGLDYGTRYFFVVTATRDGVESGYSNEVEYEPTLTPVPTPTPKQGWWKNSPE